MPLARVSVLAANRVYLNALTSCCSCIVLLILFTLFSLPVPSFIIGFPTTRRFCCCMIVQILGTRVFDECNFYVSISFRCIFLLHGSENLWVVKYVAFIVSLDTN